MWFEQLTGFKEKSAEQVRQNLKIEGDSFISEINGQKFAFGQLQIATLKELTAEIHGVNYDSNIQISEIVADVRTLHQDIDNSNSLFQAASQFNLLEMIGPHIMPENGITRYEEDYTQGPACAIACGAGTIFRNYFVKIDNQIGQNRYKQIDCLDLIAEILNNEQESFWKMQNGYAMFDQEGILALNKKLASLDQKELDELKQNLKIGIQWNTEVTKSNTKHLVSQIYCSALPVSYCRLETFYFEKFARIILEATYEATLAAALINYKKNGSKKVFLTLVGGSAFGNDEYWILESMAKSINKFKDAPLDVKVVSFRKSNLNLIKMINEL
jgi:hypothetical protein